MDWANSETWMVFIWLAIFIISIIIEATTTDLVSIWFGVGSIVAIIVSLIPNVTYWIEIIIFAVISFGSMMSIRPLAKKYLAKTVSSTNIDEMIGKKGIVIRPISELERGEVKINDVIWTAINVDEKETVNVNEKVEIVAIKGNKLIVKVIENKEKKL